MAILCKSCDNEAVEGGALCASCRQRLGLVGGTGVRRELPCQRCNHTELIRALARQFTSSPGEYGKRETHPMTVTADPIVAESFWSGRRVGVTSADVEHWHGPLEMYICLKCGFTEWYCRDPQSIPIGEEYGTERIDVGPKTPYR